MDKKKLETLKKLAFDEGNCNTYVEEELSSDAMNFIADLKADLPKEDKLTEEEEQVLFNEYFKGFIAGFSVE